MELGFQDPGIVASQIVAMDPVVAAPLLARDMLFGFRLDFRLFGATLGSRFGLFDLFEPCDRADGDGSCDNCSCEIAAIVVDEVSRG